MPEEGARGGIEARVGLVEQPQRRTAGQEGREGDPAALPGREAPRGGRAQTTRQAEPLECLVGALDGEPEGADGEADVLRRTQLVVEGAAWPRSPT